MAIDRRVMRTRKTLKQALISLILEKGYEVITIKDICDTANVGRATFYAHYKSKDDLKRSGIEENLRRMLVDRHKNTSPAQGADGNQRFAFSLAMFEHARDRLIHSKVFVIVVGRTDSIGSPSR
jgi:AcrR family transcriptional regulator